MTPINRKVAIVSRQNLTGIQILAQYHQRRSSLQEKLQANFGTPIDSTQQVSR